MTHEMHLIRKLVSRGLVNLDHEPMHVRADLFEAVALVLDGEEADEASRIAAQIRANESAQSELFVHLSK
jgi:hypothetical protein